MLPKDSKVRREQAQVLAQMQTQMQLDPHLREKPVQEKVMPYSDKLFRKTAIEWLVSTDQVCNGLFLYLPFNNHLLTANRCPRSSEVC